MRTLSRLMVAALAASTASTAFAADNDPKRFAGTTLDMLYAEISFIPGLKLLLPEFEAKTGIKVNIETMAEAAAVQKAQVESATGTGAYDILGIQSGNLPLYAQNGWLEPVKNFIGDASVSDPAQLDLKDFIPSTLDGMADQGTQYCLPFFAATTLLYYQIDKLKAAGFDHAPKTLDELLDVAAKVNSDALPAIAVRGAPATTAGNIWVFNTFLYGSGGKYFKDFPKDMAPVVNSPEAVKALETYVKLKQSYTPKGSVNFTFDDVVTAMQQGNVAMAIEGAPLAGRILDPKQSKVANNLGFAVVPGGAAGPKPAFASHGLCISKDSDSPEAAYMFLEWATSAETMIKISQNSTYLATTRNSVWENKDFRAKYDYNFGGGSFLEAYQQSLANAPSDYYPAFAAWTVVSNRMGQAVQAAEIGQQTPKDALDQANSDITDILKQEGLLK
ncbi:sugar ABC transporter substrate-binding protein [Mesorhizobium sp. BE184]|uniref:ABC transporter substrate-binding protein n=1 Tax=Mesorhizobium sp. BE184 TaxID=2817714 RepID=UPI0028571A52|nr:sugar ABC transporter substrate-binding protein [Mesorhizobium sp. BE184]MDR7033881.1 ABC-type glycerol-3-phosphate transport system substrate-binding protein [Mesorhizobium sp. BE184]